MTRKGKYYCAKCEGAGFVDYICSFCAGSGEGRSASEPRCIHCKGEGTVRKECSCVYEDSTDYDPFIYYQEDL